MSFRTDRYGDADGIELTLSELARARFRVRVEIGSYVKVGSPLRTNPYVHRPETTWEFTGQALIDDGAMGQDLGGTGLFLAAERLSAHPTPVEVSGSLEVDPVNGPAGFRPVFLAGRQRDDAKAWTSPLFITFGER